ncbi:uncharacterized protein FFC1_01061 [Fusarium fujikuroi]|nr:uncharacterized protein FFC1_01061 [Fusarium fujikuroi]
MLIEDILTGI